MNMERTYGKKYDSALSTTEIAKRFRADLKAAIAAKTIPAVKCSVRTRYFSGGSAIDVSVTEVPADFQIHNEEHVRQEMENPYSTHGLPRHTDAATKLLKELERMLDAYNHDGSDAMVDHFDVNFYGGVEFAWDLAQRDRNVVTARVSRKGAV